MTTASAARPAYAPSAPTSPPATSPSAFTATAMPSDARPPCSTRESTSLPLRSVPSGCPGDRSGRPASSTLPPIGAGTSPAAGAMMQLPAISASVAAGTAMPRGRARKPSAARRAAAPTTPSRSAAAISNPRIKRRIGQIDEQIREHGRRREHEHDGLDHRRVARVHRLQEQLTEPRQREDLLDDDGAPDHIAGVHADERQEAEQR